MLRFAHDEAQVGSGGVLYVRQDGACAYVLGFDSVFPEAFVDGLRDALASKKDHMFVVENDGARLNVHAYPREAAALRIAAMTEQAGAPAGSAAEASIVEEVEEADARSDGGAAASIS